MSLKFWVWWLLCDHGYDWVCLIEMAMAKLVLLKFCNFWGQWYFFFFKELCSFDFLEFGWLSLRWVAVLDWLHLVEILWFVNVAQGFCYDELIQIWMFSFKFVFFELELLFVVIFVGWSISSLYYVELSLVDFLMIIWWCLMWFSIFVLVASLFMCSWVFEEINPRKRKLVWYALDVEEVEFDLS